MTLTEFLLARIAEDEAVARGLDGEMALPVELADWVDGNFRFTETFTRARVLAECEAKRAIVEEHRLITDPERLVKVWRDPTPGVACERCAGDPLGDRPLEDIGPCDTLLFLAAVYADHPDYREEWRP